jgi:hypothetical protein
MGFHISRSTPPHEIDFVCFKIEKSTTWLKN